MKYLLLFALICNGYLSDVYCQETKRLVHSHNDYEQRVPFFQAYAQEVYSIEADVYYSDGVLLVGHDKKDLRAERTLQAMYITPIINLFKQNGGKAWLKSDKTFQLLIDLKTSTEPTLSAVVNLVKDYPEVFDPRTNANAVKIVITGDVPSPANFEKYPEYIFFDGKTDTEYTPQQLQRVALMSMPFFKYSQWKGKDRDVFEDEEKAKVQAEIDKAHALGKPIRFWASPDGVVAWSALSEMGVDIINTDHIEVCAAFLRGRK